MPKVLIQGKARSGTNLLFFGDFKYSQGDQTTNCQEGTRKRCLIVVRNMGLKILSLLGIEPSCLEGKGEKYERDM